jgi:hypothetical protein
LLKYLIDESNIKNKYINDLIEEKNIRIKDYLIIINNLKEKLKIANENIEKLNSELESKNILKHCLKC